MTEKKLRGFAAMDPQVQRAIASDGGRTAHANGNAHTWTSEGAAAAARKMHENKRAAKAQQDELARRQQASGEVS